MNLTEDQMYVLECCESCEGQDEEPPTIDALGRDDVLAMIALGLVTVPDEMSGFIVLTDAGRDALANR